MPTIQNTKLRLIVSGSTTNNFQITYCSFSMKQDIKYDLQSFWKIEEFIVSKLSIDQKYEKHFIKNTTRDQNWRFIVKTPLKHLKSLLGDSKYSALKRLFHLEQRFPNSDLRGGANISQNWQKKCFIHNLWKNNLFKFTI